MPEVVPTYFMQKQMRATFITMLILKWAAYFLITTKEVSCTFEHLVDQKVTYNKFEYPKSDVNNSISIRVFLHIESLREITSETTLDFYLVQFWYDPRLSYRPNPLKVTGRVLPDNVWYPDTYFLLVRSLLYSREEQYIVFKDNGSVEYNRKVRLKTPCSPNVVLFPFDVVTCSLVLLSFGYTEKEVRYLWDEAGVYIDLRNNNVDHLGFYLIDKSIESFQLNYAEANYSALRTIVYLRRKYSAYLMQVYFPAALIVILSWTIFWINLQATPARASLGVTTVLTMLTLATQSTSQNAKHVNGKVTAIDIYLWACFVFVIFAMLEFAMSDFTTHNVKSRDSGKKRKKNPEAAKKPRTISLLSKYPSEYSAPLSEREAMINYGRKQSIVQSIKNRESRERALNVINNSARLLFPLLFLLFNVAYWITLFILVSMNESRTKEETARANAENSS